ncbi:MAG TPA: thermonuclease family protein [Thermodesulfovibrionales bacterium]|nr:thermonuclease family protein [Thermodesulfovibrionales bacterium]
MNRRPVKLKKFSLIPTIFFIVVAVFYLVYDRNSDSKQNADGPFVPVVSVSDGDTVTVMIDRKEEKIRLIGIDAPELGQKPWGQKSKLFLQDLLKSSGWKVQPEYDVDKRDKYGRLLAYLRAADGQLINLLMVKNGYAAIYTFPPNVKYVRELRDAQRDARDKKLGIWSEEGLKERPKDYRREHPRRQRG